ncbi:chitin synthesis regulation, resistance to congo red-domain-containing protein [Scheffersomyces amazonensis]|uniref:chitin synthesis regulation, resistance to congo red-domain-containing protein n=1 Tax=Scheffersomyces amazonensis TaxID=1078765 RepID=UPI00315D82E8
MPILKHSVDQISKRDYSYWTSSGSARWAFFAVFILLVLFVVIGTLRVNKKRGQQGIQPIYGTRWLTPPSYNQSQNQYNQPDHTRDPDLPGTYVPTYTERANEYDMGYYDNQGAFHVNPNAKAADMAPPQPVHQRNTSVGERGPVSSTIPQNSDSTTITDETNDNHDDFFRRPSATQFRRPSGAPPTTDPTTNVMYRSPPASRIPGGFGTSAPGLL